MSKAKAAQCPLSAPSSAEAAFQTAPGRVTCAASQQTVLGCGSGDSRETVGPRSRSPGRWAPVDCAQQLGTGLYAGCTLVAAGSVRSNDGEWIRRDKKCALAVTQLPKCPKLMALAIRMCCGEQVWRSPDVAVHCLNCQCHPRLQLITRARLGLMKHTVVQ